MDKQTVDGPTPKVSRTKLRSLIYHHFEADLTRGGHRYYIDAPCAIVRSKPSAAMAEKLEKEEKARIEAQREKLGQEGLAQAQKILDEAKKEHEKPIPTEVLTSFPVPDVKSISWVPVQSVQEPGRAPSRAPASGATSGNADLHRHVTSDGADLPFFVQYDHVQVSGQFDLSWRENSGFVNSLTLSRFTPIFRWQTFLIASARTSSTHYLSLPISLCSIRYMSAYLSSVFSLPITRSTGERLTHEEVVNRLDNETVSYEADFGSGGGSFSETMRVTIKVETKHYETAIAWLKDLIYGSTFDPER